MLAMSRLASMALVVFGNLVGYSGQSMSVYVVEPPSGVTQSGQRPRSIRFSKRTSRWRSSLVPSVMSCK